jgi:hypothetical protein
MGQMSKLSKDNTFVVLARAVDKWLTDPGHASDDSYDFMCVASDCIEELNKKYPDWREYGTMSTPGDYYSRKHNEAKKLAEALDKAIQDGKPKKELDQLRQQLELARYVGD